MDEFALIRRYFAGLTPGGAGVVLGIGDDAALLRPSAGCELVVTSDSLVAGRHFNETADAFDIGWKSLAVNLSDLAAMAAQPRWFTLALTLPQADDRWLAAFAEGLGALARQHGVVLVGGDTTRGPLSVTITALGEVPAGQALRRDGARPGDAICVTGTLGDAALALQAGLTEVAPAVRLNRPEPRIAAGLALRTVASAAIDLSDGLAGDLQHILDASGVGAVVDVTALPASPDFASRTPNPASRLPLQLAGGDDYELCICLPESAVGRAAAALDVPLTRVGRIDAGPGLRLVDADGHTISSSFTAYRHFP